ncbi:MAG: hypothetical protein HQ515_22685 [Phycisphaeraceae bacterium]|nr:hypothetical protein [Phycisphaeraceae bacterium]
MSNGNKLNLNSSVLTLAITVVVLAIVLLCFWDRQQQRALELHRIENQIDMLEDWGVRPQMQPNTQLGQQMQPNTQIGQQMQPNTQLGQQMPSANNLNTQTQANGGRIF